MPSTILDTSDNIRRDRREQMCELVADMAATAILDDQRVDTVAMHTRPTLLRRIAGLIAEQLPPGIDRILGTTVDTPLAVAVSLHTGIPFTTVDLDSSVEHSDKQVHGELYPGEDVALVAMTTSTPAAQLREHLAGLRIGVPVSVVAITLDDDSAEDLYLFRLAADGLQPR